MSETDHSQEKRIFTGKTKKEAFESFTNFKNGDIVKILKDDGSVDEGWTVKSFAFNLDGQAVVFIQKEVDGKPSVLQKLSTDLEKWNPK